MRTTPPPDRDDVRPPKNPVDRPDIAVQINPCLDVLDGAAPKDKGKTRALVVNLVAARLQSFVVENSLIPEPFAVFENPEVRFGCVKRVEHGAIWRTTGGDPKARQRGFEQINIRGDAAFGLFISAQLLRQLFAEVWARIPKKLTSYGAPDPNGPLRLDGYSLDFVAPNQIVLKINATYSPPYLPSAPVTLTVTDTLGTDGIRLKCESKSGKDVGELGIIAAIAHILLFAPTLGSILGTSFSGGGGELNLRGIGGMALSVAPQEILLDGNSKLQFQYADDPVVAPDGILMRANIAQIVKKPMVFIGPTEVAFQLKKPPQKTVRVLFDFATVDMKDEFTSVKWATPDGKIIPPPQPKPGPMVAGIPGASPGVARTAEIEFDVRGATDSEPLTRRVSVQVTDTAKQTASDSTEVTLSFFYLDRPPKRLVVSEATRDY